MMAHSAASTICSTTWNWASIHHAATNPESLKMQNGHRKVLCDARFDG
jgi:hypothetical protein